MKTQCSNCLQRYEVALDMVGTTVSCEACGKAFVVKGIAPSAEPESIYKNSPKEKAPTEDDIYKHDKKPEFKLPILSQIYIGLGIVWSILLVLLVAFFITRLMAGNLGIQDGLAFGGGAIGIFFAIMIFFGMAQIVTAICETAYNTRFLQNK